MLSWTARVNLQDSIQTVSEKLITDNLKQNPLIKITGKTFCVHSMVGRQENTKIMCQTNIAIYFYIPSYIIVTQTEGVSLKLWA